MDRLIAVCKAFDAFIFEQAQVELGVGLCRRDELPDRFFGLLGLSGC